MYSRGLMIHFGRATYEEKFICAEHKSQKF